MKTPEEILELIHKENDRWIISYDLIREIIIPSMEEYGKQQYNQAIKDAAENAKIKPKYKLSPGFMDQYIVDKDSILKLLKT